MGKTNSEFQQCERIRAVIHGTVAAASRRLAAEFATLIRHNSSVGRPTVLGLAEDQAIEAFARGSL